MSTLSASITLVDLEVPVGTVVSSYTAILSDGQVTAFTADAPTVSFSVGAGKFTVTVRAIDANGIQIGTDVMSNEVEVLAEQVPATIKISVPSQVFLSLTVA